MIKFLLRVYSKVFFVSNTTWKTNLIYKSLSKSLEVRVFIYWFIRLFVKSLKMESTPWTYESVLNYLQESTKKTDKVLDYWCGQHQSKYIKELWFNIYNADIIDFKLEKFTHIDWHKKDLPFLDNEFDTTICSEVIEHVRSPFLLIDELCRITQNTLIISTPNPVNLRSRFLFLLKWYLFRFWPDNFEYHYTPVFFRQLENYFKANNYTFQRSSNHKIFWLNGDDILFWETLIYKVSLWNNKSQ